jgi:hypothetical protein
VRLGDNVVSSASLLVESFYGLLPSAALVLDDSQVGSTLASSLTFTLCSTHADLLL